MKFNKFTRNIVLSIHFVFIALWLGGVVSGIPLVYYCDLSNHNETLNTYYHLRSMAWNVIGWGGIGSFFTGLLLAIFTTWTFKHLWVLIKLILVIGLILFGMFFNEHQILANIEHLETIDLVDEQVKSTHRKLLTGLFVSASGFVIVIFIAVFKPFLKRKQTH